MVRQNVWAYGVGMQCDESSSDDGSALGAQESTGATNNTIPINADVCLSANVILGAVGRGQLPGSREISFNEEPGLLLSGPEADPSPVLVIQLDHMGVRMEACWEQVVDSHIDSRVRGRATTDLLAYRRELRSADGRTVLSLLWCESEYVSPQELLAAGRKKSFPNQEITQHKLARFLAQNDIDRYNRLIYRVSNIVNSGVEFGLIRRVKRGTKRYAISGTEDLHRLMNEACRARLEEIAKISPWIGQIFRQGDS